MKFVLLVAVLFCGAASLLVGADDPQPNAPPELPDIAALVKRAMTGTKPSDRRQATAEVVALGAPAGDEVLKYLKNPDSEVRRRALDTAAGIQEVAKLAVLGALRSKDYELESDVTRNWVHEYLNDPEVFSAWTNMVRSHAQENGLGGLNLRRTLSRAPENVRAAAMESLAPTLRARLSTDRAPMAADAVELLGEFSARNDQSAISAIKKTQREVRTRFTDEHDTRRLAANLRSEVEKLEDVCLFALANLGDEASLRQFVNEAKAGDKQLRRLRLSFLSRFSCSIDAITLASELLDDQEPCSDRTPSPSSNAPWPQRFCDLVMPAVAAWCNDCAIRLVPGRRYDAAELEMAKACLAAKMQQLIEPVPQPAEQAAPTDGPPAR